MDKKLKDSEVAKNEVKKGVNPLLAGVTGAALTALAAGAAIILSDKKKRRVATKMLNNISKKGKTYTKKLYDASSSLRKKMNNASKKNIREENKA